MAFSATTPRRLVFVDAHGGALAALAAGVARSLGHEARAETTTAEVPWPPEVADVLAEIGAAPVDVTPHTAPAAGVETIRIGHASGEKSPTIDAWLYDGEGELERLSAARIARDRVERFVTKLAAR
ncbi:MAG TPA: hypothetical protein VGM56_21325 [Byssovorax sp.]|jgi:hypothetical protein